MRPRTWTSAAVLAGLVLAGCSDNGTAVQMWGEGGPAPADELVRVDWAMDAITVDGERREIDPTFGAVLRFDGDGGFTGETCNQWGGTVAISDDQLVWGDEFSSTAMGCLGGEGDLESDVLAMVADQPTTWTLDGDALRIESVGRVLELHRVTDAFPSALVQIAAADPDDELQWQIGYAAGIEPVMLSWEGRGAPGQPWGMAGMAVDSVAPIDGAALPFADQTVVFGYVPPGTTSATYVVAGAAPALLELHELPNGRLVVGSLVPQGAGAIVATAADGTELGRTAELPGGA